MLRVIYNLPNADPQMDGLEWTEDRGELISPELTQDAYDRYLTIPGFRAAEMPQQPAPVQPAPVPPAPPPPEAPPAPPPTEPPTQGEAPPAPPAGDATKPRGKPKPATDAGAAGDTQKE